MNIQVGKSTGIALLLAAGLLAALFAMGVFSANTAKAEVSTGATAVLDDSITDATGVTLTVTFQVTVGGDDPVDTTNDTDQAITITLPTAFAAAASTSPYVVESLKQDGNDVGTIPADTVIGNAIVITSIDVDGARGAVAAGADAGDAGTDVTIVISGITNPAAADDYDVTVAQGTQTPAVTASVTIADATAALSSQEPGAAVQITLRALTGTGAVDDAGLDPGQDITVDLTGFGMPASMADSAIDIVSTATTGSETTTGFRGSPRNVLVTGSKITMTVPNVNAAGSNQEKAITGAYSVKIKQAAGITNPAAAGSKTITLQENAPDGASKGATVYVNRVVKLDTTAGTRGTVTTATFKGFANGTATVDLNEEKLGEVTIAENLGTLAIDTTSSDFKANQPNEITAEDSAGNGEDVPATFTISPKIVLDPEETSVSKEVTVKLSDWAAGHQITEVTIGARPVTPDPAPITLANGKVEFKIMVPATANRGTQTVKVTGTEVLGVEPDDEPSTPSATASLKVGVLTLTAQPAMVVPGQQITIQGSGFVAGDAIDQVKVGDNTVILSPAVRASSAGDIVITINVPSAPGFAIGDGEKTITVEANAPRNVNADPSSGRVAEGSIEIPEAEITLTPDNSRRGTTVNVSGTGFPSGDLVQVEYDNSGTFVIVSAGAADASGAISVNFKVPSYAKIGAEHDVEAASVGVFAGVTAEAVHETPGAMVTLSSDQIASGQKITVSGMNFPAFATVAVMEIGGVDVRPVPAPATSIDGDFESIVLVPQLELGNQTVSIRVSSTTITTFLEIATATVSVSTDPAEVFGGLGDRLVRVWYLDRATQVWSFYDPDPDVAVFNTLTEVSSGQNVSIIISAGDTIAFQGDTLYQGTNPIGLE